MKCLLIGSASSLSLLALAKHPLADTPHHIRRISIGDDSGYSIKIDRRTRVRNGRKTLKATTAQTQIDFVNNFNLEYVGPMFLGNKLKEVQVVYDTGSDWLVVGNAEECVTCDSTPYDTSDVISFEPVEDSDMELTYGSAYVMGFVATDNVCSRENAKSCANMEFLSATYVEGLDGIDGIAGMSTGLSEWSEGPRFIEELYNANKINAPVFGFYLAGPDEQSYLDVGVIQKSAMRDPTEMVWIDVENESFWWEASITGIKIQSQTDPDAGVAYSIKSGSTALTDTGSSCTYIPPQYYSTFAEAFMKATDSDVR